jgi:4-alpha-glucanotransferase
MASRPYLRALAARLGILDSYLDQSGRVRTTSDAARAAVLRAMRIDVATEAAARDVLSALHAAARRQVLKPTRVADAAAARMLVVGRVPRDVRRWQVEVSCEGGEQRRVEGHLRGQQRLSVRLSPLPPGYHDLVLVLTGGGGERRMRQRLIVVPPRCVTARDRHVHRVYGLLANVYTLRSAHDWGIGDFADLRRVVDWAGSIGAAFVGANPLHALDQISPYSPRSRLYREALYLDITAVPEWAALSDGERRRLAPSAALDRVRAAERIDYAAVRALKRPAFAALHRVFAVQHGSRGTARGRAYARYVAAEGEALVAFATFAALHEHFERRGLRGWRHWPAAYRDPHSAAVRAFRAAAADAIDRQCFLQFEIDRQLEGVAARARARGLPIGVYQDLALGSSRRGSDTWAFGGLFLDGLDIGAPPDDYSPTGQNWGLPPIDPRRLAADGYEFWVRLLRTAFRHAGALRIDHILGLFRQYWIPAGASGEHGVYVKFPSADLLGILALESQRGGAVVIGEDLGTVPRGLPTVLARWGILSTRVLYFERGRHGGFRAPRAYPARALVCANTHDLVPLAGFWEGRDLVLRQAIGLLRGVPAVRRAHAERTRERHALLRRLRRDGLLARHGPVSSAALRAAVHAFLARTSAALVGVSLDDLAGETTPVNQPGVSIRRYRSWSRRMRVAVESFRTDPEVAQALNGLPTGRRRVRVTR